MKKNIKINSKQYSEIIVYIITQNEKVFFHDSSDIEYNLFSEALYFIFHLYLSEQILLKKYNKEISKNIINNAINSLVELQFEEIEEDKSDNVKTSIYNYYKTTYMNLEKFNFDILNSKEDLIELSKTYLECLNGNSLDGIKIMNLNIQFSTFITYHFSTILNKNIKLLT